jgi:phosphate transport system substrate-binding protein
MRILVLLPILLLLSCSQNSKTIKIKGSDTEVNLAVQMAESFRKENKKVLVSVSGGGSGLGIASLLNGNADIANSSRSINPEERALFRERKIELDSFIFAQDAIAFIVSEKLPIDAISTTNLGKIMSGEYTNWSSICKKDMPINIYGRQNNSGTHDFVKKRLRINFSPYAKQMNGNAQILEAIKVDSSGIGYVGAGYVMKGLTNGIRIISIYTATTPSISPLDTKKISLGQYYFQRPLYQYFKKEQQQKLKPFLDFEKSSVGASIIKASGYYTINQ